MRAIVPLILLLVTPGLLPADNALENWLYEHF